MMQISNVPVEQFVTLLSDESVIHEDIVVNLGDLRGPNGNAFAIIGSVVANISREAGPEAASAYSTAAMAAGSYAQLLKLTSEYVTLAITGMPSSLAEELQELQAS